MFSLFRRRRLAAEEKRQERKIKEIVCDIAYARGMSPREYRKRVRAEAKLIVKICQEQAKAHQTQRPRRNT